MSIINFLALFFNTMNIDFNKRIFYALSMKKLIRMISFVILVAALGFAGFLGYATLSDYNPGPVTRVFENKNAPVLESQKVFTLLTWNLGYGGLGQDMDFFYDGGKKVRPLKPAVEKNLDKIESFLARQTDVDFFLLQEVDQNSKRSYAANETQRIKALFPGFFPGFGKNYDVFFVPVPLLDPMGRVLSGIFSLSRFEPVSIDRFSLPGTYQWPQGLFMLDRCFLAARYRLDTGKDLLIVNTHNEAYDDGSQRKQQLAYLKEFLIQEYEKGNHVLVGGDWNQCPPKFNPGFKANLMDNKNRLDIDPDYLPGWKWAYDQGIPTNRRVNAPYDPKTTLTTVIDFFLLSPNIELKDVQGIHLDFEHSDHNPVKLVMILANG